MGRAFEYRKARIFKRNAYLARTFTRIGKEITMAAKAGGPDPDQNSKLRLLIQTARNENMPKDNIDRAIKRAFEKDQSDYKEMVYEGRGPHGIAILIEAATDNNQRIETIAQAAEDHRASATAPPRSLYGRLVAEADRLIVPETIIRRTVQFGLSHYPELGKEGHWQRTLEHLHEKYAEGGYLHLLIPGSPNEEPLERLREIIKDERLLREMFERFFAEEA